MPAAPRMSKKLEKIAFKVLGKPDNYQDDPTEKQKEIRKRLDYEDTYISR